MIVKPLGPNPKGGRPFGFRESHATRELVSMKERFRRWALRYWPEALR